MGEHDGCSFLHAVIFACASCNTTTGGDSCYMLTLVFGIVVMCWLLFTRELSLILYRKGSYEGFVYLGTKDDRSWKWSIIAVFFFLIFDNVILVRATCRHLFAYSSNK